MPTTGARPGVRERLSDLLLRVGADVAADAREVRRGLDARPAARGYETAVGAVAAARFVGAAALWLSWRLRPSAIVR